MISVLKNITAIKLNKIIPAELDLVNHCWLIKP